MGSPFSIAGANFTPGSEVNFFVATATGTVNAGPFTPSSQTPALLTVNLPAGVTLGQGFASAEVVNKDGGFAVSNLAYALLQGDPAAGIPTIKTIDGRPLDPTSSNPDYAANNISVVLPQGSKATIGGSGFDVANGVAVDLFCACPPAGKIPTIFLNPGNPGLTTSMLTFDLPATGLPTGPGSFVVSNKGGAGTYAKKSNAVSVPIGARITVSSVSQTGSTITVNGTGFSTLTVINFFNTRGGATVNLGGVGAGGAARIPLSPIDSNRFTFTVPASAVAGSSYVQALNPPFVPFSNSGNGPGGAFVLN